VEGYADQPGQRGRLNFSAAEIRAALERSLTGPAWITQGLCHSVGDGTTNTILDLMEQLAPNAHWRERRLRIEHGDLLRPAQYTSAWNKGLFIVQNPLHFALADLFSQRFSSLLLQDLEPMCTLLEQGIGLAFGSDAVADVGNPFLDIFFAVIQPSRPAEALTVEQAVIAYTHGSAAAESP
jgi:predicted amidohydrolase YtcJ